jgi:hypothetical protein
MTVDVLQRQATLEGATDLAVDTDNAIIWTVSPQTGYLEQYAINGALHLASVYLGSPETLLFGDMGAGNRMLVASRDGTVKRYTLASPPVLEATVITGCAESKWLAYGGTTYRSIGQQALGQLTWATGTLWTGLPRIANAAVVVISAKTYVFCFDGEGGYALVTDADSAGVLRRVAGGLMLDASGIRDVAVTGTTIYVATENDRLLTINAANPYAPAITVSAAYEGKGLRSVTPDGVVGTIADMGLFHFPGWYPVLRHRVANAYYALLTAGGLWFTATVTPPPGPADVGWWKLNETSGVVAADSSGGGHPAAVTAPTWNSGLVADGTGNGLAAVTLPISLRTPPNSFSCWFTPATRTDAGVSGGPYSPWPPNVISNDVFGLGGVGIGANVWSNAGGGGTVVVGSVANPVPGLLLVAGHQYHLAVTYGLASTNVYVDSVMVATAGPIGYYSGGPTSLFRMNYHNEDPAYSTARFAKGTLRDVRVYSSELTAAQVAALFAVGPAP